MSSTGSFTAAAAILFSFALTACGGGGNGGGQTTPQTHVIGGSITGLNAPGLVLQDNGGDNLAVAAGATSFTFAAPIAVGGSYSVTVLSNPANTTCAITNGVGFVAAADITNVVVNCTANGGTPTKYTIGGTISGLNASGLVLQDNGGDDLTVASGATSFTFATPIATGGAYSVTVKSSPANTTCSVAQGSGTVAAANITNVAVTCTHTISGQIVGLIGSGLVLSLNGNSAWDQNIPASAQSFTFTRTLAAGSTYDVIVKTAPTDETCSVTNGTGTIGSANVTNVIVSCSGQFVYVSNATDGTNGDVSQFTVDPASGALSAITTNVTADKKPSGIAVNYAAPQLYVANAASPDVTAFSFDTTTAGGATPGALSGALDALTLSPNSNSVPTDNAPVAVAPSGAFLFAGVAGTATPQDAIYGFTLSSDGVFASSSLTADSTTATDGAVSGLTVDPSSTLLFATISATNHLVIYSIASGAVLTAVPNSPFTTGNHPRGVVTWPKSTATAGFVYTANQSDNNLSAFSYSTVQGALQLQPATTYSTGQAPAAIAIDPTGAYLYTANSGDGTVSAFSINQSTGALTALGTAIPSGNLHPTVNANPGPVDLKVDPSGRFLYCVNGTDGSVSLFTLSAGAPTLSNTYATGAGATAIAIY
jgi:6-phosphogluconolactonase (cycloisomerase 2 family)